MSQLVLDDQLDVLKVLPRLRKWTSAIRLQALRPGEHILDDRVPELLLTCHTPTFVTIDAGFWKRDLCHARYCIVVADIDYRRQDELPELLRKLFQHSEFKTTALRMGRVIRFSRMGIWFWEIGVRSLTHLSFSPASARRRKRS